MSIHVVLYGQFRDKAERLDEKTGSIGNIELKKDRIEKVEDVLKRLEIDVNEVSHIFLNREYSALEREVHDGDRVALFPRDMGLLYKWYFSKKK